MSRQSEITFSIWRMFVKNQYRGETWILPTLTFFEEMILNYKRIKSKFHSIEKYNDDDYILIVINSGDIEPRSDYLIDIETTGRRENPRKKNEVELTKQVFIYYDFISNLLYISGVKYKNLFEDILNLKSEEDVLIKGVYEGRESFLNLIKYVNEISFKTEDNIFQSLSDKRKALFDLFETNELSDLKLDIKMKGTKKEKIIQFLNSLFHEQQNHTLSGLLIRGKDETNFEYVYNIDSFVQKVKIVAEKQDSGKFQYNIILDALQRKIREISDGQIK